MSKKRFWSLGLLSVVTAFLVAACGGAAASSVAPAALPTAESPRAKESPAAFNRDCPDQTDSSNHVTLWDGSNYKRAA